jgi:CHAT domain-containing protein
LGNRPKALEFYNQALALRREIGDRRGETIVLTFMGFAYTLSGELQKAMDCHTQALQIRREIGDARLKAVSLFHIGVVYHRLGEPQRALSYHLQALPALRSYGETGEEARTLSYMGEAYFSLGQFEQALDCFEQSLAVQNRDFKRIIARNVLRRMASVYIAQSQTQKALDVLNEALALEQQYGDTFNKANILVALGNAHYTLGNSQKAREYLVQAMPLLQAIEDRPGEAKAHYLFSQIERDKNNLSNALTEIESAVRLVESMRSRIVCQELRASFFSTVEKYYDQYLQVLWQLHKEQPSKGYDEKALLVSEQTRARSLIELLNESGIDIRQGVSKELLERERILQKQLNEKAKAQLVLSSERATPEQTAELAKEIQDITSALQNVQTQIRKESPRYAALTQPRLLSLREMQETLDENTLLLEYKLGEERSFLWAVTKNELRFYELPKRAEIETQTRKVYQLLTARNQQPANETDAQRSARLVQAENEYNEAASQLSETLIGPIASILKSQRLLIVSDGALQYIPFAALPGPAGRTQKETGGGQPEKPQEKMANNKLQTPHSAFRIPHSAFPLIFNHEVVCLPSASVIAVLRRETSMRKPAPKTVAVFADPVFAADDVRIVGKGKENKQNQIKSTQRGIDVAEFTDISFSADSVKKKESSFSITRLPFSRREANAILSIAPADETYAALDFEANRANAISPALAQYRIVHFATHGWLDSGRPELSGIVLSLVDEKGQPQEGILRLHEIYNLELNADLVVLSACQTGLGKEVKGEGLVGLTRGFMYAGAARVAASLWKVDDAATAELMASFYHFMLKEKMTPSAALRAAQIKLLKEKRWRSPYFWASFVIQGEWR